MRQRLQSSMIYWSLNSPEFFFFPGVDAGKRVTFLEKNKNNKASEIQSDVQNENHLKCR